MVSLLTAALLFAAIPENPPGDGFAAGLTGIFVLLSVIAGILALAEAGILYFSIRLREPSERSRRVLTIGAVAGSLSILLLVVPVLVARVFDMLVPGPAWGPGIGLVLVPIGIGCSVLGVVLQLFDGSRTRART
ncbi:hypothetical protein [Natrinema sp. DC36]|uniref:hypothetical protein n=1 Tax=Natrinema sp. DC36 TaxID=2878680 RepID=UPI001CEFC201|nr:hypothetical protein [Natrinema sp. DC36]